MDKRPTTGLAVLEAAHELALSLLAQKKVLAPQAPAIPAPPNYIDGHIRSARRCPAPLQLVAQEDLDTARTRMPREMRDYIMEPDPGCALVVANEPGLGKTTSGVNLARAAAQELGGRVLYAAPRHKMYDDVMEAVIKNNGQITDWYHWLPRQDGGSDPNQIITCLHANAMQSYLERGFQSRDFCYHVCGDHYMKNECFYLAQSKRTEPIIFGQHQHVAMGHPNMKDFRLIMGDENPMTAFVREWIIPGADMHWKHVDYNDPLAAILHRIQYLAERQAELSGYELFLELDFSADTGFQGIIDACRNFDLEKMKGKHLAKPEIKDPKDVANAGYNVLPVLVPLLLREAEAAQKQWRSIGSNFKPNEKIASDFLERIYLADGKLKLLTRYDMPKEAPKHIIWFDATANADLYSAILQRDVRILNSDVAIAGHIYQVSTRQNNKTSLTKRKEIDDPLSKKKTEVIQTSQAEQLRMQVEFLASKFDNPAIVTFKDLRELMGGNSHFYANRGTNEFVEADAMIVAGTPMPPREQIEQLAKCIWFDRMERFDTTWVTRPRTYNYVETDETGETYGWEYPTGEYADPNLNTLLWQMREAEIIQSAHRARILYRDVPVYLLTNIPIQELPLTRLISIHDVFGAPPDVDPFKWGTMLKLAETKQQEQGYVTLTDLMEGMGVSKPTAIKYMDRLIDSGEWEPAIVKIMGGRGRPPKAMTKGNDNHDTG